jgi:hypothetical protein
VRDLGGDLVGPGPRTLFWDGRDDLGRLLPAGPYVVLLEILLESRSILASEKAVSALFRETP